MNDSAPELPMRESFARSFAQALALGVAGGVLFGACEALKLILHDHPRYASWAVRLVWISIGGYALLAIPLALVATIVARILWGRVGFRVAPPSACAGLGVIASILAFQWSDAIGLTLLPFVAVAFTLLALALRELLAWWSAPTRAKCWFVAALVATIAAFCAALTRGPSASSARSAKGPNVVLLSIDTVRADRLGCYGSGEVKTPNLDALASDGVLFENSISQANITGPSHTTMLTGLYPAEHGVLSNGQPIPHKTKTWVEDVGAAGWETAGFVSGFTLVEAASGLAPRFERFDDALFEWRWMPDDCARLRWVKDLIRVMNVRGRRLQRADRPAGETIDSVQSWIETRDASRPFFLFAHFYDPHAPYHPPAPFDRMYDANWKGEPFVNWYTLSTRERKELVVDPAKLAHMLAEYHGEISYADEQAGRLIKLLRDRGVYDDTLIVFTSDHGEELGEHEIFFDHGATLYDSELHVPLIVKPPRSMATAKRGSRVATQVRTLDLGATICDVLGVKPSYQLSGASLAPLFSEPPKTERDAFSFSDLPGVMSDYELDARALSLRQSGFKWIWTSEYWLDSQRIAPRYELYDVAHDPLEAKNLLADPTFKPSDEQVKMRDALDKLVTATAKLPEPGTIDPDTRKALRSLGYFGN